VLSGLGERRGDVGQGARLQVLVGDGAGKGLGLLVLSGPGERRGDVG
jgi:hypothetical protein